MNKSEILDMSAGREIDALTWLMLHDKPLDLFTCRHVDGDIQPHSGYPSGHISPPNYSTDISDAWTVLLNFKEVYIEYKDEEYFVMIGDDFDASSENKSAPLAICRAALLAVMDFE